MARHDHSFGFEADFVGDLRCIPMAVRRKLDLVGVKLKLSHWSQLGEAERQRLLAWPDDDGALEALDQWLKQRTAAMAEGAAGRLEPASHASWQQAEAAPEVLLASCRQLGLVLPPHAWGRLDELQRFALVKLSHPGHEHRNLPRALAEFGLADPEGAGSPV
ncbi:nitrate reductase associated protein [Synechococcus sp. CCY 9618]|uniref:nitrate reductase associated protein n=1 Tax=Synechococcus sp. CCY 9618 TaxID=2815602 RepID=UPI001C235534|nr:nitrate reductase associated protein [Synechococcus sp. CCY 9618]